MTDSIGPPPDLPPEEGIPAVSTYINTQDQIKALHQALDADKKKYGAMLPSNGVYFLPDERVVAFLKLVNAARRRYEEENNYLMADQYRDVFKRWSLDETNR